VKRRVSLTAVLIFDDPIRNRSVIALSSFCFSPNKKDGKKKTKVSLQLAWTSKHSGTITRPCRYAHNGAWTRSYWLSGLV
jgi:hypothetical protein